MKTISISLSEQHITRINALKEILGAPGPSEVIRRAIDLIYNKEIGRPGQRPEAVSRVAKRERDNAYEALLKMNDDDLTDELDRIGAIEKEWKHETSGDPGTTRVGQYEEVGRCLLFTLSGKFTGTASLQSVLNKVKANLKKYYP